MEFILYILSTILTILGLIFQPLIVFLTGAKKHKLPPIRNELLKEPAVNLILKIRKREIKSEDIVLAYIARIKEVNPFLNAVIEDRFEEAIKDAKRADRMLDTTPPTQLQTIFTRYPLLGIPFTVKESCGLKGMLQEVGHIHRRGMRAPNNGDVVENLRSAGGIPLLVSANPEFCLSWETNTVTNGRCNNPYDTKRSSGGSSGGEGSLNGAGASLFGVGSDVAGSIRLPGLFNGVFGHKPTGGLVSTQGHFPNCDDKNFNMYLQLGPLTRFAKDLPLLLQIMAGDNAVKLEFTKEIKTKDINIFYMEDYGFTTNHMPVTFHNKLSLLQAVEFFKRNGLKTQKANLERMRHIMEMSLVLLGMDGMPNVLIDPKTNQERSNVLVELSKHILGKPEYSLATLAFNGIRSINNFVLEKKMDYWWEEVGKLKKDMMDMLGTNGVFFFPTFHTPAFYHNMSIINISGVSFLAIFNSLGFPATHVPMGLNPNGLPIGFQVVAAPYQDKLCLQIAGELDSAFGGWVAPT